jgi:putative endopeptidase
MTLSNDPIKKARLDTAIRPQDDFFHYANGGWIRKNQIPDEESVWGSFHVLNKENQDRLHTIMKRVQKKRAPKGTPTQLVRDFWISGMDMNERDRRGFDPIAPYATRISTLASAREINAFIADMNKDGFGFVFGIGVGPDDKDSETEALHFHQGGLSLPDRDFYLKQKKEHKDIRAAYLLHVARILSLYGYGADDAKSAARTILRLETRLAQVSMSPVELRDPHAQYNPHTLPQLKKLAPQIDWADFLKRIGTKADRVIVGSKPFLTEVSALLESEPIETWRTYLLWHLISGSSSALFESIGKAQFDFYGTLLQGTKAMRPLWRRVTASVDVHMGDALGQLYVADYFPPAAKKSIDALVKNVMAACEERIMHLGWMTPATKKKAIEKLHALRTKVGYPKKWLSYKGVRIEPDDYFGNILRANRYEHARAMRKIGKKPDRDEWLMTPSTVNAYFHPNLNEIVFPAGILQPPFFDPAADDAINYGAIGAVIGHEITHAFDDEGRKFDHKGNLKDWWVKADETEFKKRAEVLKKQYDAFEVIPGHKVNGALTLGENIADLGGVLIAYDAWKQSGKGKGSEKRGRKIGGLTPEQRFFLGNAIAECSAIRDEALKKRLISDPHSPSVCRVNVPLANVDAFYEAFGVQEGDALYLPQNARARIW